MVEAAIVTPLLFMLVFGIIEFGLLFKDYLTVANATRTGARVAAQVGASPTADHAILQAVKGGSGAMDPGKIQRVVVYKASGFDGDVPEACKTGSQAGVCNSYTGADLSRPVGDFGCGAGEPDASWCPTSRNDQQTDPPDYVGIWIKANHDYFTGFFGSSRTFSDQTVMRIEPVP
jgi:hypothetical protein